MRSIYHFKDLNEVIELLDLENHIRHIRQRRSCVFSYYLLNRGHCRPQDVVLHVWKETEKRGSSKVPESSVSLSFLDV